MGNPIRRLQALLPTVAIVLIFNFIAGCSTTESLRAVETSMDLAPTAKYASLVVDANNGKTLAQENASDPRYPASLTKMMTLYLLFEAMEQGRVSKTTVIPVSAHAASQAPSKIGFRPGETIPVDAAIQAMVTKSANDVAVAVGEFLGGSEESFAAMMTAKARQLGMTGTTFRNASGLPDEGQVTTARDMALLGMALRQRFPDQYGYFSVREFTFRGRTVRGHNDLLGRVPGVDGIKTGYIRPSGYNIVTSVQDGGRRLVVVVMGGTTANSRNAEVEDLIARYLPAASRSGGTLVALR